MAEINTAPAYPVDSEIVVTVPTDFSAAFMIITAPANGGKTVDFAAAMTALRMKGVSAHINEELIRKVIENNVYDREFRAADAVMPVDGDDGTVEYLFDQSVEFKPVEDENGYVDYRNMGFVRNIQKGTVIAKITLPTQGTPGSDVRGVEMAPVAGRQAPYVIGEGTVLSDNGCEILAAIDGNLTFRDRSFCVDKVVTVKGDLDASVGNIDFFGDVVIKGDILDGFTVISGGDVTVSGSVSNATVKTAGKVTVKQGAINADITAHGSVSCDFCEYSKIRTDGEFRARSAVMSTIYCGDTMNVKQLIGGTTTCLGDADITNLGAKNFTPTEIIMGDNAVLNKERDALAKTIADSDEKLAKYEQVEQFLSEKRKELGRLPEDKEEMLLLAIKSKLTVQMERKNAEKRIKEINGILADQQLRTIFCRGHLYPGVHVIINKASRKFDDEFARVVIKIDENGGIITANM